MHFSTATGTQGDKAYLESRLFYPKRHSQCLQFYYYSSGGADDQLNIWVREYTAENPKGDLRLIQKISGNKSKYLKCQIKNYLTLKVWSHVPLFSKILQKKSSRSNRNLGDRKFCVKAKKVPAQISLEFKLVT